MHEQPRLGSYPWVLGIFSTGKDDIHCKGIFERSDSDRVYWYVRQLSEEEFEIQPLNKNHVPAPYYKIISLNVFSMMVPEPTYYNKITLPVLESLKDKINKGYKFLSENNLTAAEKNFLEALKIDIVNVEANIGLGVVYAERKEYEKIKSVLDVLLEIDSIFRQEHRNRFNELGIILRKNGYAYESMLYFKKAIKFCNGDDHLHFNLARTLYDLRKYEECRRHIELALSINPELEAAMLFNKHLDFVLPVTLEGFEPEE